jgi:hypothetical protein
MDPIIIFIYRQDLPDLLDFFTLCFRAYRAIVLYYLDDGGMNQRIPNCLWQRILQCKIEICQALPVISLFCLILQAPPVE